MTENTKLTGRAAVEDKAAKTHKVVMGMIDDERTAREAKTHALRAQRLARDNEGRDTAKG